MKRIYIVLLAALLASCSQVNEQEQRTSEHHPVTEVQDRAEDSSFMNPAQAKEESRKPSYYESNFREIELDEMVGTKTLQEHLADPFIPLLFKDIFQKKVELQDDDQTLAIPDSLFSKDKERHPFYFTLVTRTIWWADGAFAEPLYSTMKEYVESNPQQLIGYFRTASFLTEADFNNWADGVAMEVGAEFEKKEREEIARIEERMIRNCTGCNAEELTVLKKFIEKIKEYSP
ncbi:hypothetical protein H7F15_19135 [Pontibacter sp. Tf4]|uniref:hypothetical protein n=1 Tax=Pontibacter sp. Tf4 TaxID=2761620 RepID=UPI0016270064|nr:hypothetical protein [Pontibacter sp. Tf4]MBB6613162.1 hypothetical protein [Pontibacter sp. Tf4]